MADISEPQPNVAAYTAAPTMMVDHPEVFGKLVKSCSTGYDESLGKAYPLPKSGDEFQAQCLGNDAFACADAHGPGPVDNWPAGAFSGAFPPLVPGQATATGSRRRVIPPARDEKSLADRIPVPNLHRP